MITREEMLELKRQADGVCRCWEEWSVEQAMRPVEKHEISIPPKRLDSWE